MPLSSSVMINKDEILELLDEALARLPDELRAARWLLKEREEFLAKTRRDADDILDAARARAERMVQRTEVVKAADLRARQTVDAADEEARRLRQGRGDGTVEGRLSPVPACRRGRAHGSGRGDLRCAPDRRGDLSARRRASDPRTDGP